MTRLRGSTATKGHKDPDNPEDGIRVSLFLGSQSSVVAPLPPVNEPNVLPAVGTWAGATRELEASVIVGGMFVVLCSLCRGVCFRIFFFIFVGTCFCRSSHHSTVMIVVRVPTWRHQGSRHCSGCSSQKQFQKARRSVVACWCAVGCAAD